MQRTISCVCNVILLFLLFFLMKLLYLYVFYLSVLTLHICWVIDVLLIIRTNKKLYKFYLRRYKSALYYVMWHYCITYWSIKLIIFMIENFTNIYIFFYKDYIYIILLLLKWRFSLLNAVFLTCASICDTIFKNIIIIYYTISKYHLIHC